MEPGQQCRDRRDRSGHNDDPHAKVRRDGALASRVLLPAEPRWIAWAASALAARIARERNG